MNETIIENDESGKKPRRIPKKVDKESYEYSSFHTGIESLFDNDFIEFTLKRLKVQGRIFDLEAFISEWRVVADIYDKILPFEEIVTDFFEDINYIRIDNDINNEYFLLDDNTDGTRRQIIRLSLPVWPSGLLYQRNHQFIKTIRDLENTAHHFNLSIVPLDEKFEPKPYGLFVPMFRKDGCTHPDLQAKYANMYSLSNLQKGMKINYDQSFENKESLLEGFRFKFMSWVE